MSSFGEPGRWCRSCGASAPQTRANCERCGVDLAPPDSADYGTGGRVGHIIHVGKLVLKRPAIVLAETDEAVTLVSKGDERTQMATAEFDQQQKVVVPGPEVTSGAGRLWKAAHATAGGAFKANFSVEHVDQVAWEFGRRSLAAIRASILDRMALGADCDISYLPVTASEMAWYKAYSMASAGKTCEMLEFLRQLPPKGYDARCELITARAADLVADPALASGAVDVLRGVASANMTAQALIAAFDANATQPPKNLLTGYAEDVARKIQVSPSDLIAVADALANGRRLPALAQSPLQYSRAFDAYLAALETSDLSDATEAIVSLPLECIDELVDIGALTRLPDDFSPWVDDVTSYVKSRVSPGTVDEDTLRAAGFTAELARRAFMRADRPMLDTLPAADEGVKHYKGLLDLQDDLGGGTVPADLRPTVAHAVTVARAIAAEGTSASTVVPDEVLGDPTLWPLLQKAAETGNLRPANPANPAAGEFVSWAELCQLQRKLFEGSWSDVIIAGNELANRTQYEAFADEALNMAAFASLQLGRIDDGMKLIDRALDGQFTTGLVANAAVLASSRGSQAAIPYLLRIFNSNEPLHIRSAAARRAVELWMDDPLAPGYPTATKELVRHVLASTVDDQLFVDFCKVSAYNDEDWFATAAVKGANTAQRFAAEYFSALAKVRSDNHKYGFDDFCGVVAKAFKMRDKPDWVEAERARILAMLDEGLHTKFGDAPGFALGVQVLIREDALEPYERIWMGCQAAAHIAMVIDKDDGELAVAVENTLVHDGLALYKRTREQYEPRQRDWLEHDVARSVYILAAHVWSASGRARDAMADVYNSLNYRKRSDPVNFAQYTGNQRGILAEFDREYASRCRRLISALRSLPLDEDETTHVSSFQDTVNAWDAEAKDLRRAL